MRQLLFSCVVLALAIPVVAQKPIIFDVSDVVVGAQKIPTLYLIAEGKWSDAGEHVAANSTWITCYKSLGFCDVANANWNGTGASVSTADFDILRWDSNEIIAVDSSPICLVNTLRVDLVTKRITLSSSDKGVTKGPSAPICKLFDKVTTAVLWGLEDTVKDEINRAKIQATEPLRRSFAFGCIPPDCAAAGAEPRSVSSSAPFRYEVSLRGVLDSFHIENFSNPSEEEVMLFFGLHFRQGTFSGICPPKQVA